MSAGKLQGVEAARGLAAMLVVLVHASAMLAPAKYLGEMPLAGLFKFGHAGVDYFFVLSGFIIYFIHAHELGQRHRLGVYWQKRFVRIYPVYWIVLAGYGLLLWVSPTPGLTERIPAVVASAVVLYPHSLGPILGVAWSLSHEILFYLMFSVLFISRTWGRLVMGVWGVLIVFNVLTGTFTDSFWGGFVLRLFNAHFFFGLLVAHAVRHWPVRWPALFLWGGTGLFFGAGLLESWGPAMPTEWPPLHLAYACGAAAMLYGVVMLERSGRLVVPRLAVTLGTASYSIYLLHTIIIVLLQQVLLLIKPHVPLPPTLVLAVIVVVAVGVSVEFSRRVEQPLMRRLRPGMPQFVKEARS